MSSLEYRSITIYMLDKIYDCTILFAIKDKSIALKIIVIPRFRTFVSIIPKEFVFIWFTRNMDAVSHQNSKR